MRWFIDPRHGDIEDDWSSTKRRSLLSLAGSLAIGGKPLQAGARIAAADRDPSNYAWSSASCGFRLGQQDFRHIPGS